MFELWLEKIARELDSRGLPYMVIGGQAVLVHGEPRLTRDIDVTLGVGLDRLEVVVAAARFLGLELLVDPQEFTPQTLVLPCRDTPSGVRVDFILSHSVYERQAIERAKAVALGGYPVKFATAEDLVVHKVLAGRPRDLEDARLVLLKNPGADREYVRGWLSQFEGVVDEPLIERFEGFLPDVSPSRRGSSD